MVSLCGGRISKAYPTVDRDIWGGEPSKNLRVRESRGGASSSPGYRDKASVQLELLQVLLTYSFKTAYIG